MAFSKHKQKSNPAYLIGLSIAILLIILILGLRPKGFYFSNNVHWITDQFGIRFHRYGIAYTDPLSEWIKDDMLKQNRFSMEIALKPASTRKEGFNFILAIHSGEDSDQLLIGQWGSWIIIMNGDDYDHKRKTKRISVNVASMPPVTRFITVTTGKEGTKVYLEGRLVSTKQDLTLKIPSGGKSRLLLGNSIYGRHSWRGDIYGLAFYDRNLSNLDASLHYNRWFEDKNFSFAKSYKPLLLYCFNQQRGSKVLDDSGGNHHLEISKRMQVLKREMLSSPCHGTKFDRSFLQDIIINFIGFMPFGFVLAVTLIKVGGSFQKHYVLFTIVLCFIVSLVIETAQSWMPSRSSQIIDLILNTSGAIIGVIIWRCVRGKDLWQN